MKVTISATPQIWYINTSEAVLEDMGKLFIT